MKKFLILLFLCFIQLSANAYDNVLLSQEIHYQTYINDIGVNILNKNKINKRVVFVYNQHDAKPLLDDPSITKRQVILYKDYFKHIENNDELAAFLSREISRVVQSYSGEWGGLVSSTQIKMAPKKYEIFADKRAVDYMVKAGYNPLGLITYINKTQPQGLLSKITHNAPSKRMAIVYEYIYFNYPQYLSSDEYLANKTYQNFLLTSSHNRVLLNEKIKTKSTKELKYE